MNTRKGEKTITLDNEFLLQDRLQKIKQIINQYGEENFYVSFSGGKDSTVLSALVDMAIPGNQIPRVFADTGIEFNMIRDFVKSKAKNDSRFIMIKPSVPIKPMLEKYGYPFKSKNHAAVVASYQRNGTKNLWVQRYLSGYYSRWATCPKILRYQFSPDFNLKISDKCCHYLKTNPLKQWQKENKRPYGLLGLMPSEGGRRKTAKCLVFSRKKLKNFQPLVPVTKSWEDWFIEKYNVEICDIYKPPYNMERTGCKGCPFNLVLQTDLDMMEKYLPEEKKQCERIWEPVYREYRRLNYRLRPNTEKQITFKDDEQ